MAKNQDPALIHRGIVKNGKFYPHRPDWYYQEMQSFEGKEIQFIFEEVKIDKTIPQLALYFGVVIKKYLMNHPDFAGWTWREIDSYIRENVASYPKTFQRGTQAITIFVHDEIRDYSREQMRKFMDDVLNFLAQQHEIFIEDPYQYKLNKYLKKDEPISRTESNP
jgi:hypothetical protein